MIGPSHTIFAAAGWVAHNAHRGMSVDGMVLAVLIAGVGIWANMRE